jgi:hypothetical protein
LNIFGDGLGTKGVDQILMVDIIVRLNLGRDTGNGARFKPLRSHSAGRPTGYGDSYYLVVRCEGGWAATFEDRQRFAVVVELTHQAEVQLYERLRARARV